MSCYSYVHLYNPAWEDSRYVDNLGGPYNRWQRPDSPLGTSRRIAGGMASWWLNKELGAWFEYPLTACLDRSFYRQLTEVTGRRRLPVLWRGSPRAFTRHNSRVTLPTAGAADRYASCPCTNAA